MNAAANQPPVLPNGLGHLSWAGQLKLLKYYLGTYSLGNL